MHHVLPTKIPMIDFIQLVPQNNNQKNKLRHQSGTTLIPRGLCQYTCMAQCCRKLAGGHYCGELPCPKSHCSIHCVQPPVCSTLQLFAQMCQMELLGMCDLTPKSLISADRFCVGGSSRDGSRCNLHCSGHGMCALLLFGSESLSAGLHRG